MERRTAESVGEAVLRVAYGKGRWHSQYHSHRGLAGTMTAVLAESAALEKSPASMKSTNSQNILLPDLSLILFIVKTRIHYFKHSNTDHDS